MKISIGFSTSSSWLSRAIRWFLKARVSHTFIRFYDTYLDTELIIHADYFGVVVEDAEIFAKTVDIIEEFEIEHPKAKEALRKSLKLLKKKYDYWGLFGWAWFFIFKRWAKIKLENPIDNPASMICSDFCKRYLRELVDTPRYKMNPKSLNEWMNSVHKEHGWGKRNHDL